jgi:hypothetical protein
MVESSSGAEVKFHKMGAGFPPVISRGIFSRLRHFLGKRIWGKSLSLNSTIFHGSLFLTQGLFPKNEEISAPPPYGFLFGIYKFYENWSTETFRKKSQSSGLFVMYSTYKE